MKTINPIRTINDEEIKKVRSLGYIKIIFFTRIFLISLGSFIGLVLIVFYLSISLEENIILSIIVLLSYFGIFFYFVFGIITSLKYFRVKKDKKVYKIKDKLRYQRFFAIRYVTTFHLGDQSVVLLPELYMDLSKIELGALAEVEAVKIGKKYVILSFRKVEEE